MVDKMLGIPNFAPAKELSYILPKERDAYFVKLIKSIAKRYKGLNLSYAFINKSSKYKCDYLLIYQYTQMDKEGKEIGAAIGIIYQPIYSQYSLPGYRYCLKNLNKMDGKILDIWFDNLISSATYLPYIGFRDILGSAGLSMNENEDNFWKKPENFPALQKILSEFILLYKGRRS